MAKSNFSEKIINEIFSHSFTSQEERFSYLSAIGKVNGAVEYKNNRMNFNIYVPNMATAINVINTLKVDYSTEFELLCPKTKTNKGSGTKDYCVSVPAAITMIVMQDLELLKIKNGTPISFVNTVPEIAIKDQRNATAYLIGLYVACGNCFVPSLETDDIKKDGYHFEYSVSSEDHADSIIQLLSMFGIPAKKSERSQNFLIYLKDKDEILSMLGILGVVECVASLKTIINERLTANIINRNSICEAANLDKTFEAASKHLLAIGIIEETIGLESLSKELYDTAQARITYPRASLSELADILGVSKSCLNHRLRKIVELSEEGN